MLRHDATSLRMMGTSHTNGHRDLRLVSFGGRPISNSEFHEFAKKNYERISGDSETFTGGFVAAISFCANDRNTLAVIAHFASITKGIVGGTDTVDTSAAFPFAQ